MKHPFLNLSTWYGKEPKLIWMPWMANAASLSVSGNVVDVAMIKQIVSSKAPYCWRKCSESSNSLAGTEIKSTTSATLGLCGIHSRHL